MMPGVAFDDNVIFEPNGNESQVHPDTCNSFHDTPRVALVTLHRSANYGSVLQALATQIVLERMGCEVQVVDYYPYRNTIRSMLGGLKEKTSLLKKNPIALAVARAIILPSYLKRRRVFDRYIKANLNLTPETYGDAAELERAGLKADVFITGSDQVWNSEWNGGIDEPLFLSFAPQGARRLSFSASFGKGGLEPGERKRTAELLSAYESISVREDSGVEIIRSLGLDAVQVLDPTLFLDAEEWGACCASKAPKGDYILMYNINHNRPLDKFVRALSVKTGLPIHYISYQLHDGFKKGHMHCCVSVEEFLSLIKNARYVVCDSFHCAAYSVNFNKEFAIVPPKRFGTRLTSFMRVMGLENRIVGEKDILIFDEPIKWDEVNRRLKKERERSFNAIRSMIFRSAIDTEQRQGAKGNE